MKKFLSIILAIAITLSFGSTVVSAKTAESSANSQLFIETTACPQGYVDFAEGNIAGFVESYCEGNVPYTSIMVGTPFAFLDYGSDVYYFPVICDGVIRYVFRVYPNQNNGYDAAISSFLAEELESLAKVTSANMPLKLNRIGNEIIASIGNEEYILFTYPDDMNDVSLQSEVANNRGTIATKVIDAKTNVGIDVVVDKSTRTTNSWSYYIDLDIIETQGSNSWCAAYCTSTILRTLGYSSTAEGVMSIFYRRPGSSDSISREQVVSYANMRGLNPIRVESTVAYETLRDDLRSNRPVYFSMSRSGGNHAVVLRGYNSRRSTWSIWNPWFTSYETFSMGGTYVPTGYSSSTYSYTYARTIYNWAP